MPPPSLALDHLGDPRAAKTGADIACDKKSRWRRKRNTSILAHGVTPTRKEGFIAMQQLATEFLGFNLTSEANPIPPFYPRWLLDPCLLPPASCLLPPAPCPLPTGTVRHPR